MLSGSGLSLSSSQGTALVSQLWVQFQLNPWAGFPCPCSVPVAVHRGM